VWAYGYIGYNSGTAFHPVNKHTHAPPPDGLGGFRSELAGGANFAMADGSVQSVRDTISPTTTYRWLATRAGCEVVTLDP
jgi:prepilin-type processing-associated H-X9-DG protein